VNYKYVKTDGQFGSDVGRLGNETFGGEIQLTKKFESPAGAQWEVGFMLEQYADWDIGFKKFYAGASNVFASQPDAFVWGGRVHNMRPQTHLSNYFVMVTDGQGGGVKNLDLGLVDADFSVVAKASGDGGSDDDGLMAATSKFHGINIGDASLSLIANYGFDSAESASDTHISASQFAAIVTLNQGDWKNKLTVRQSFNTVNKIFKKSEDVSAFAAYLEGSNVFSDTYTVYYEAGYNSVSNDDNTVTGHFASRDATHLIVRPMVFWDDVNSTWLEAGVDNVSYDNGDSDSAWKVTLSQNISIKAFAKARPMLRFYATYGEVDNASETTGVYDVLTAGAMFESWW
jgi:maltoporin